MNYTKFRGRGLKATESFLGADGIMALTLDRRYRIDRKTLLFQSKIGDAGGRELVEQVLKLSTWREAAVVFSYSPERFGAFTLDDVLEHRGRLPPNEGTRLDDFLADHFLECTVGDDELRYDAIRRELTWRATNGELVSARFAASHRIGIKIQPPESLNELPVDKRLKPEEVHSYRMQATPEEILTWPGKVEPTTPQKAQRELLKLYHPDVYSDMAPLIRDLATKRAQDIGQAFERIRRRDTRP